MKRIALFALRELHIPCLLPVFEALREHQGVEVGFLTSKIIKEPSIVPFEGIRETTITALVEGGKPFWGTNLEGVRFDCVVTADFCAGWIEGWGPSVCVGHGTISKNIYFTANATARRESYHDALCVPGPWFASSFGHFVKTRVVPTGFPKMDEYAVGNDEIDGIKQRLGFKSDRIHVLLAPTFNPEFSALPVAEEALRRIDTSRFHVHVKLHGATDQAITERVRELCAAREGLHLSEGSSVAPLLLAADMVITDVSSILLEAVAADKKVIAVNNPRRFGFSLYDPDSVEFRFRDAAYEVWDSASLLETLHALSSSDPKREVRQRTALQLFGHQDGHHSQRAAQVVVSVASGENTRSCPFSYITVQPAAGCPHAIPNILWNLASRRWKQIPVIAADPTTNATLRELDQIAELGLVFLDSEKAAPAGDTLLLTGEHHFPKDWDYVMSVSLDFIEGDRSRVIAPCLLGCGNPFQRPEFLYPNLRREIDSSLNSRPVAIEFQKRAKFSLFHESHAVPVALADGCLIPGSLLTAEVLATLSRGCDLPSSVFHPMNGLASPRVIPALLGIPGAWNSVAAPLATNGSFKI